MATVPSSTSPESFELLSRTLRAFLTTQRNELLTPVQAIVAISDRIMSDPKAAEQPGFMKDIGKIRHAAEELCVLIENVLAPAKLDQAAEAEFQELRSRLRHNMLNKLNPVINFSEMWIEDAAEYFLEDLLPDLQLLHTLGKKCFERIDTVLASWNMETSVDSSDLPDLKVIQDMVQRMSRDLTDAPDETGHVLVVDDNDINRDILRRLLESHGHTVEVASNGRDALNMLAEGTFDLVLLDIVMPEMDGFAVLIELKSDPRLREVPVIMISALNEIEYVVSCIKMGAEDYLARPYNAVFLKARIGACLEKKRLREREKQHLIEIERERTRADELLHVILPAQIVEELKATNTVAPRRYEEVAVLFADIVDFTPYCEKHTPEEVVFQLQKLIKGWEEAAQTHAIQKIKTIGDAFMAACGLLVPVENPVLNCIRFGQEMIALTQQLPTGWNLRVGIHFGQVLGGVLGSRQYLFDLFGDTVNTAARMESHGVSGAIALSAEAWNQVADVCKGSPLEFIHVKGKGQMARHRFHSFR